MESIRLIPGLVKSEGEGKEQNFVEEDPKSGLRNYLHFQWSRMHEYSQSPQSPRHDQDTPFVLPPRAGVEERAVELVRSSDQQERLEGVEILTALVKGGNQEATETLLGCTWDLDTKVREAAEAALKEVASTRQEVPSEVRREDLMKDMREQIASLSDETHVLHRQDIIRGLSQDAAFFPEEFRQAVETDPKSFVETLLRIERDTRLLYSTQELEDNFPIGWHDDQTQAITSLILQTPNAQEVLLGTLGGDLGGVYSAETLAAVYLRDYDKGKELTLAPLREALLSEDLKTQFQALTTVLRLGESAETLLPGISHLLSFTTREEEIGFPPLNIVPEEYEPEEARNEERLIEREDLTQQEKEERAKVRGLVRSITSEIMKELDVHESMQQNFEIIFPVEEAMQGASGFALPYVFAVDEKYAPVLAKVVDGQELDHKELVRALNALDVILHEGRHLAQYRVIPYHASAACAQEVLQPGLRHLPRETRSDVIDGARSSSLMWAHDHDLSERLGEALDDVEDKVPLSLEMLRATFVHEVDAYSYAYLKLFQYVERLPSLLKAWERYENQPPPKDEEFYEGDDDTAEQRKAVMIELLKVREGDEKPFSYFRRYE